MNADHDLLQALRLQAEVCREFGSAFNGAMLAHMAADLEAGGPVAELLAPWRGASRQKILHEAAPIRLVNAFTHLAMGDETPELSRAYPRHGAPGDAATAWRLARALVPEHRAALTAFMAHEPQTNEVRRSGVLLGGFLTVTQATGLPLRTFELGASAGLNLLWDRFRYRLGEASWGDPDAAVVIPVDWSGPLPPLDVQPRVIARAACDRRPTDLADPAQRRRLLACVWPDQFDRLARSRAAIDLARAESVVVEAADALDWVRTRVRLQDGAATVLYHSIFWQYPPQPTREGLELAIAELAAQATVRSPFAWLRMEPPADNLAIVRLDLTMWPGGESRRLAEVHPHGAWVRWF